MTPKALGFTMPGEFEKHAGCWMGWPYDKYLWREDALPAKKQYAAVAKTISQVKHMASAESCRGVAMQNQRSCSTKYCTWQLCLRFVDVRCRGDWDPSSDWPVQVTSHPDALL